MSMSKPRVLWEGRIERFSKEGSFPFITRTRIVVRDRSVTVESHDTDAMGQPRWTTESDADACCLAFSEHLQHLEDLK